MELINFPFSMRVDTSLLLKKIMNVILTVTVIISDPPGKDGNSQFTTVFFKVLFDQISLRYQCL